MVMKRRKFFQATAATVAAWRLPSSGVDAAENNASQVMTVTGTVAADELGTMLPHEHVLVDFIGADGVSPDRYDPDEVFRVMLPHLKQARDAGCQALAECTPQYLGRDPKLLKRLTDASGIALLTNTGYYGARHGKFLPPHATRESAEELADRWTREWEEGINGTGIRPGFIKIGVDAGPLTDVNRKLVKAAARCHLRTGLTIAGHTGDGVAALQQVEILKRADVSPSSWIWVHAQNERNPEIHRRVARAGAWVEFDGIQPDSTDRHVQWVKTMRQSGLLDRVLLSHDAGWFSVGQPRGGQVRGYDVLFTRFLPALRKAGFRDDEITQLTRTNPASAFSITA